MFNDLIFLPHFEALKSGTDLWILSNPELNTWNSKIDWYLGFQFKKSKLTKFKSTSHQIQSLCTQYQLPLMQWNLNHYPTLIESSTHLPNLWTVELPYTSQWTTQAYRIWDSLNQPTLRIFIPKPIDIKEIKTQWQTSYTPVQYVLNS